MFRVHCDRKDCQNSADAIVRGSQHSLAPGDNAGPLQVEVPPGWTSITWMERIEAPKVAVDPTMLSLAGLGAVVESHAPEATYRMNQLLAAAGRAQEEQASRFMHVRARRASLCPTCGSAHLGIASAHKLGEGAALDPDGTA